MTALPGRTSAGRSPPDRARRLAGCAPSGEVSERVMHLARLESAFCARARAAATGRRARFTARATSSRMDPRRSRAGVVRHGRRRARGGLLCARRWSHADARWRSSRVARCATRAICSSGSTRNCGMWCSAPSVDELVGPVAVGSRHEVVCVVDRRPADLADPLVRARAEAAVVDQMIARAILTHVRWAERPRS